MEIAVLETTIVHVCGPAARIKKIREKKKEKGCQYSET